MRSILRDEAEVEDVMQEAYVQAFTHLDQFLGHARFSTSLTRIAVHEATFGHAAAEVLGKSLDVIIPEQLRKRHWAGYDAVISSGVTRYGTDLLKVPALHRDGRRLSIEFRVMLLRNDQRALVGIAAFLRDVTVA